MRIGLNLLYLVPGRVGGSEIMARRMVDAVARLRPDVEFLAYTNSEAAASLRQEGWPVNVRIRHLPVSARVKPLRLAAELTYLPALAQRDHVDLLHSLGTTSPPLTARPSVATILDLVYEYFPEVFPAATRLGLKAVVGLGARRASRVIAISRAAARDVVERLHVRPDRVDVVHLGFGMRRAEHPAPAPVLRERFGLGTGRVVLCVSAALAHKNLHRLIDAFARLGPDCADAQLVLVGHTGREHAALREHVRAAGVGDRVTLTGWIADDDLEGLYSLAACAAYPSLHEGFGLPVLEAMARDVPLACSTATSLPEVAGDAAELFDPHDVDAIAAAIRRLLGDPDRATTLVARGRDRVRHFTWERCAEGVWATYEKALRDG